MVDLNLAPAYDEAGTPEALSFSPGTWIIQQQAHVFQSLVLASREQLSLGEAIDVPPIERYHIADCYDNHGDTPYWIPEMWTHLGYPMFRLMNFGRLETFNRYASPLDQPSMRDMESLRHTFSMTGEIVLSLAHGVAKFPPMQLSTWKPRDFAGPVLRHVPGRPLPSSVFKDRKNCRTAPA